MDVYMIVLVPRKSSKLAIVWTRWSNNVDDFQSICFEYKPDYYNGSIQLGPIIQLTFQQVVSLCSGKKFLTGLTGNVEVSSSQSDFWSHHRDEQGSPYAFWSILHDTSLIQNPNLSEREKLRSVCGVKYSEQDVWKRKWRYFGYRALKRFRIKSCAL